VGELKAEGGRGRHRGGCYAWEVQYRANPVTVEAWEIVGLRWIDSSRGDMDLELSDGAKVVATAEMTARYTPVLGDYWVRQEDDYCYVNPKNVFERKYSPLVARLKADS